MRDAERPGEERAKVLDFGLAKIAAELIRGEPPQDPSSVEEGRGLTEPHMAMGSPAYMAPEQWQSASDVSPKADVYALGVILYESQRPVGGPAALVPRGANRAQSNGRGLSAELCRPDRADPAAARLR